MAKRAHIVPPEQLGKYQIRDLIGSGGYGDVFKGFDPFVQREVAIKITRVAAEEEPETAQRRFFAEARAAGMLQHANIVSLYDAGVEQSLSYIVMEYINGHSLRRYGRKGKKRPPLALVLDIAIDCCRALEFSHQQGVIHRDIKPGNIMRTKSGQTKIMDFGIAQMASSGDSDPNMAIGTPNYMPPEQVLARQVGPPSDLYSLAAVMFEMLSGRRLFEIDVVKELFVHIISKAPPKLSTLVPDLPPTLSDIIARCLLKDAAKRYADCRALAEELIALREGLQSQSDLVHAGRSLALLARLSFFDGFSPFQLDEIFNIASFESKGRSEEIIKEGSEGDCFYVIVKGEVRVSYSGVTLDTLSEGDCFGEAGYKKRHRMTVIGLRDVILLRLSWEALHKLSEGTILSCYRAFVEILGYRMMLGNARILAAHKKS